jgi:Asp-tRNA(Asn)/Glu-tRNA(Gln) amidotransferase A subunit family amidase
MAKQLAIAGTEADVHDEIDEAIEALREARDELRRATLKVRNAEATLVQRMMSAEVARYDHVDRAGGAWAAAIDLPTPSVRLKFIGNREAEV